MTTRYTHDMAHVVTGEAARLKQFLSDLAPQDWNADSACQGWIVGNVADLHFSVRYAILASSHVRRSRWYSFPCSVPTVKATKSSGAARPKPAISDTSAKTRTVPTIPFSLISSTKVGYLKSKSKSSTWRSMGVASGIRRAYYKSVQRPSLTNSKKRSDPQQCE